MKKLALILILISCLSLTGCGRDAEANAFMKEYAAVTADVAAKLEDGKIDEAREAFDSKKASLDAKWDAVKQALPFQLTAETKKRMNTEPEKNMTDLAEAGNKAIKKNPNSEAKVQALVLELANVFRR
jgi:Tfp pilus assembly protein PilP